MIFSAESSTSIGMPLDLCGRNFRHAQVFGTHRTRKQDELWFHTAAGSAVSTLLSAFNRDGVTELDSTIERLARNYGLTVDQTRAALVSMTMSNDLTVQRRPKGEALEQVDPATVASHARIYIVVDWEHIDRTRMVFQLGMSN